MKLNSFIYGAAFLAIACATVACAPIEDSTTYTNDFDPEDIQVEAIQVGEGSNGITLKMTTPGVTGYWDYNLDKKYSDEVTFNYPIPGEATFTFHATTPYTTDKQLINKVYAEKSVTVSVTRLDQELPQQYYYLVGSELEGKTWVFDGTANDGNKWWYMCAKNNPDGWKGVWWNAGGTGAHPADYEGKMVFDLEGAANYTYYSAPDATPITGGSWKFNKDYSKLTVEGDHGILGSDAPRGSKTGEYVIISLTDDEMILYASAEGWIWVFKSI